MKGSTILPSPMATQMYLQQHLPIKSEYGTVKIDSNYLEFKSQG